MRKPGKGSEALVFGAGDGCGRGTLHTQNQGVNGSLWQPPRPPKCRLHTESAVYSQLGRQVWGGSAKTRADVVPAHSKLSPGLRKTFPTIAQSGFFTRLSVTAVTYFGFLFGA